VEQDQFTSSTRRTRRTSRTSSRDKNIGIGRLKVAATTSLLQANDLSADGTEPSIQGRQHSHKILRGFIDRTASKTRKAGKVQRVVNVMAHMFDITTLGFDSTPFGEGRTARTRPVDRF